MYCTLFTAHFTSFMYILHCTCTLLTVNSGSRLSSDTSQYKKRTVYIIQNKVTPYICVHLSCDRVLYNIHPLLNLLPLVHPLVHHLALHYKVHCTVQCTLVHSALQSALYCTVLFSTQCTTMCTILYSAL